MHSSARYQTTLAGVEAVSIISDRTFPRHSHDEFGFGYIVHGGQDSWSGRGLVEAHAGDTITVNPAEIHDGIGRSGEPRQWRMLYLSSAAISELSEVPGSRAQFSRPVCRSKRALSLAIDAIKALTLDQPDRDQAEQLVMLALAAHLDTDPKSAVSRAPHRSREVQVALDMIFQNWEASLSLADLAKAAGTSKFQILRRFSREMGATPHAYLTQHRVKRAKDMIVAGSSLADTAFACGFADQSHMTRTFSRQLGLTPGSYAQRARS